MQGNPWRCSCENVWLGLWLRRWMRETLQLHTSGVERGQAIQSVVRTIQCQDPNDPEGQTRPLVDLDTDVKCYQEMPVSSGFMTRPSLFQPLLLVAALIRNWL